MWKIHSTGEENAIKILSIGVSFFICLFVLLSSRFG